MDLEPRTSSVYVAAVMSIAALAAALTACAQTSAGGAAVRTPSQEGRIIAQRECARCHAVGPLGDSPRPDAPPLRDVLDGYSPDRIELAFREGLVIGHPDMPVFDFSPQQIDALLTYIQDIND